MGRTWTVNGTDETSVLPVKAPRDALTGKAAFQAAGYRRRGSRRSERGGLLARRARRTGRGASRRQGPRHKRAAKSHAWDRHGSTRGTGQVPSVKQAGGHGKRMFGGLLEHQLPFKRVKTAIVSFMLPLGACPALPSGASQAFPAESLKYETTRSLQPHRLSGGCPQRANKTCPAYFISLPSALIEVWAVS